jgi:hypothetical protein
MPPPTILGIVSKGLIFPSKYIYIYNIRSIFTLVTRKKEKEKKGRRKNFKKKKIKIHICIYIYMYIHI